MKKNKIKKFIVILLSVLMVMTTVTGCTIIEYQDDRDMRQVILNVNTYEMEYEVPFYVDLLGETNETVLDSDGKAFSTVQRDLYGDPVLVPVVSSGKIVYVEEPLSSSDNKEIWYYTSEPCYITYEISGNEATSATVWEYIGCKNISKTDGVVDVAECDYTALWENIVTGEKVESKTIRHLSTGDEEYGTQYGTLPVIELSRDDGTDWEYYTAEPEYVTDNWTTAGNEYTKQTLIQYYNSSADSLTGLRIEDQMESVISGFYMLEFSYNEAENYIKSGDIEWGLSEINAVNQAFYSSIDEAIESEFEDIHTEKGEDYTAPDKDDSSITDEEVGLDEYLWEADMNESLGIDASDDRNSLVRRGFNEWITTLQEYIDEDYAISEQTADEYMEELEEIEYLCGDKDSNNVKAIYESFLDKDEDGNYPYEVMWYLYGDSTDRNLKISYLQEYVETSEDITDAAIEKLYNESLADQVLTFSNEDTFESTITGEDPGTILYYANDNYFYVKHILLPFSDDVTATIADMRTSSQYTDAQVEQYRADVAYMDNVDNFPVTNQITGEITNAQNAVDKIYQTVNSCATEKERERAFNDMIDEYNTDPGMVDSELGYAVYKTSAEDGGPDETYMIEFAEASRALRDDYIVNGELGVMSEPTLTDYGYHILYLIKVPAAGEIVGINDYLTVGNYTHVIDIFSSNLTPVSYDSWSATTISSYVNANTKNEYFTINYSAYEDLIDVDDIY